MVSFRRSSRVLDEPPDLVRAFSADTSADTPEETVKRLREEARATGYREGQDQAERELAVQLESSRVESASMLQRLTELEESLTRKHEALLLEIAVQAASRIVRHRVDAGDPVATRALQEALETLPGHSHFRVRVHPDDAETVSASIEAEIDAERIEVILDPQVSRGGATVESESGRVDATLETAEKAVVAAALASGDPP